MSRFVLDAGVAVSWALLDETNSYADTVQESLRIGVALVPSIWLLEVSNALLMAERRGRIPSADADEFLALLEAFDIVVAGPPTLAELNEILALARELHLTAYDASYVALALNEGLPLATCDETLVAACDARGLARV